MLANKRTERLNNLDKNEKNSIITINGTITTGIFGGKKLLKKYKFFFYYPV